VLDEDFAALWQPFRKTKQMEEGKTMRPHHTITVIFFILMLFDHPPVALAAPGDITLEVFGADWTSGGPINGFEHAFMCIEYQLASGIKEECYGFYPDDRQVRRVHFSGGDSVASSDGINWIEASHPFRFVTESAPCNNLQIYDASRSFTWRLPIPSGRSEFIVPGAPWRSFWNVIGVDYASSPIGFVYGPGVTVSEFCRNPDRFTNFSATFKHNITNSQRTAVLSIINNWDGHKYSITNSNCIDLVDSVVGALGLKRPGRSPTQTPGAYVSQLIAINPS
jgi:hypothetical protein